MKHHVLAIGISKHQNPSANLSFAAKDASEFFDLFTTNIGNIGYKKLLIDSEATLSQIRTALGQELQLAIEDGDAFFFLYSGHGVVAEDENDGTKASHYLVPFDATFDYVNTCIPVSYLKNVFDKIPSCANLIFIDSCFSGAVTKNSKGLPIPNKKLFQQVKTFSNTLSGVGRLTFTASKDDEEAIEDLELQNGLFTHFLLKELQNDRGQDKLAVLDVFTPICDQVQRRAKDKYDHIQTPTLHGQLEGNVLLPAFKKRLQFTPQIIQIPRNPELVSVPFPLPIIQIEDTEQERLLNELVEFVVKGREQQYGQIQKINLERFCANLSKTLKRDWDRIFTENGNLITEIPSSVAKLEAASFHFFLLGGIISAFGSEEQMKLYSEYAVEILDWKRDSPGAAVLLSIPEIILVEIVYIVGVVCLAYNNLKPWGILLKTPLIDLRQRDVPPQSLILHREIHYCPALAGNSMKVNDHIRDFLGSLKWLPALAPKLDEKVDDFQLQANLLLVLLTNHMAPNHWISTLWPDFATKPPKCIRPLVSKVKYNTSFRKQIEDLFESKPDDLGFLLTKCLRKARQEFNSPWWDSIELDEFLTDNEKKLLTQKEQNLN